jgi:hypothetical protein
MALASACGFLAALAVGSRAVWRLVRLPELWPQVAPALRQGLRQGLRCAFVFLLIAGPWYACILILEGRAFVSDFVIYNNLRRVVTEINQSGVAEFYLGALIFGLFPWSCLIPVALASLVDRDDPLGASGFETYLLLSVAVVFCAFSFAVTKFPHYVAPALVPAAVLVGITLDRTLIERRHDAPGRLAWAVAAMLCLVPTLDLAREDGSRLLLRTFTVKNAVPDEVAPGGYYLGLLVAMGACILLGIVWRSRLVVAGLIACAVLFANYNTSTLIPNVTRFKTMKLLCESWKRHRTGDDPIGFHGSMKHGIFYYTDSKVELLRTPGDFGEFMQPQRHAFCIVQKKRLTSLSQQFRKTYPGHELHVVDRSHLDYLLLANHPVADATPASVEPAAGPGEED